MRVYWKYDDSDKDDIAITIYERDTKTKKERIIFEKDSFNEFRGPQSWFDWDSETIEQERKLVHHDRIEEITKKQVFIEML